LHGDDADGVATGFHSIKNDGGQHTFRDQPLIDTILDGIYHFGFAINADGRFVNEDGNANARLTDVADWLTYYAGYPSTTGTGLDRLVDLARQDEGLASRPQGSMPMVGSVALICASSTAGWPVIVMPTFCCCTVMTSPTVPPPDFTRSRAMAPARGCWETT
jgi:hypothetical protein